MTNYIEPGDDLSKLLLSFGSISKGYGGQGQRMGETSAFNIRFRPNADPEITNYFLKIYGDKPEKINFYLPCDEIDKCITAPYTAFNAGHTLIAKSDGNIFTYIANLDNPLNTADPYLRDGKRLSDGMEIRHQPNLAFLGKPNVKMQMSGQMFVFIKELLEEGVFQTMSFRFHTPTDRDMLRKRLSFIRNYAAGINVPLTTIPMFLTKFRKASAYVDPNGVPRRTEHFYLDLGLVHFIGSGEKHPFNIAVSSIAADPDADMPEKETPVEDPSAVQLCAEPVEAEDGPDDAPQNEAAGNDWHDEVFPLSDEQQVFINANVSAIGSQYGIRPELMGNYMDKSGTVISDLPLNDILSQIKIADEYLMKIANKKITVDKQTEIKAKKRRWALITAALIKQNIKIDPGQYRDQGYSDLPA